MDGLEVWIGLTVTLGAATMLLLRAALRQGAEPDVAPGPGEGPVPEVPVAFGHDSSWLAVRADEPGAVARALGLGGAEPAGWTIGLGASRGGPVFVSPSVGGWVLVVGAALPELGPGPSGDRLRAMLTLLSRRFGEAQAFANHDPADYAAWAWYSAGEPIRAFAWFGGRGGVLVDEGVRTTVEHGAVAPPAMGDDVAHGPDAAQVMAVAAAWSLDPTRLAELAAPPDLGLVGDLPPGD